MEDSLKWSIPTFPFTLVMWKCCSTALLALLGKPFCKNWSNICYLKGFLDYTISSKERRIVAVDSGEERLQRVLKFNCSCRLCELGDSRLTTTLMFGEVASENCGRAAVSSSALMSFFMSFFRRLPLCTCLKTTSSACRVDSVKQGEKWQSRNDRPLLLKTKSAQGTERNRTEHLPAWLHETARQTEEVLWNSSSSAEPLITKPAVFSRLSS